ncbi:class I SAM-dependent methyltransferase [Candidatus Chloroploca asiatica]|uniref:Methyltransferase domain-containing protein n=1 Tax=Candidatus Chloroploca asiatica TaxID=1506545 RepID=A0A2H3L0G9_9CHLR|nr:class I SAM-dependent methyltransferase [Candidatus Chloroploca asiatica]PDV99805.1 hypothetical protein A9Q02_00915 [Candidatus Chloroploca asiatica]
MLISEEAHKYLRGEHFSNGWSLAIPKQQRIVSRNKRLVELAQNKSVLHIGCADHTILIQRKIKEGTYLHELLQHSSSKLVGVDINPEGIEVMQKLGFPHIYHPSMVPEGKYDLLIAADVIEHVPNVNVFLTDLKRYNFDRLIITTPNAYRRINRRQYKAEIINTDHRYWFSPFTLAKAVTDAQYQVEAIEFTDYPSKFRLYRNVLLKKYPLLQDGLLIIATKQA